MYPENVTYNDDENVRVDAGRARRTLHTELDLDEHGGIGGQYVDR